MFLYSFYCAFIFYNQNTVVIFSFYTLLSISRCCRFDNYQCTNYDYCPKEKNDLSFFTINLTDHTRHGLHCLPASKCFRDLTILQIDVQNYNTGIIEKSESQSVFFRV